jgi:hypothetical protein
MCSSSNTFRVIKSMKITWAGHIVSKVVMKNAQRILVVKPEEKRPLRRSKNRWKDNLKLYLKEIVE